MFDTSRSYRRANLHEAWGGSTQVQRQGGILTPSEVPLVLIVTGKRGEQFGYTDWWDDDGLFHYFGAGQDGDMEFVRGNRAIRDHVSNGKTVHLFEDVGSDLTYCGQLVYDGHDWQDGVPDGHGRPRRAIIFRLVPTADGVHELEPPAKDEALVQGLWGLSLDALRDRIGEPPAKNRPPSQTRRTVYQRSEALKVLVRRRANGVCEGCGEHAPFLDRDGHPYLEPHHLTRVADGGPDREDHVIAICPNCHRRVHSGADGLEFNDELRRRLRRILS